MNSSWIYIYIRHFSKSGIQKIFNVSREELMLVTNKRAIEETNQF